MRQHALTFLGGPRVGSFYFGLLGQAHPEVRTFRGVWLSGPEPEKYPDFEVPVYV